MFTAVLDLLFPPACGACDAPGLGLCRECAPPAGESEPIEFDGLAVLTSGRYEGPLRDAILCMKRGRRDVASALGADIACRWGSFVPPGAALVWAPTTRARRAERGFDQARVITEALAAATGARAAAGLRRTGGGAQQGQTRARRLAAGGRFTADGRTLAGCSRALLVDDVVTTGATLLEARAALGAIGVAVPLALVVARAM